MPTRMRVSSRVVAGLRGRSASASAGCRRASSRSRARSGLCRVVVEVDRAAQVDPAHQRPPVLVAQRLDLARLHRLRRRHRRCRCSRGRQRCLFFCRSTGLPLQTQRAASPGFVSDGRSSLREAVEPLAEDLPDQQAAPRLELADVARGVAGSPSCRSRPACGRTSPARPAPGGSRCRGTCRRARVCTDSSSASRTRLPAGSLPSFAVWQATQLRSRIGLTSR